MNEMTIDSLVKSITNGEFNNSHSKIIKISKEGVSSFLAFKTCNIRLIENKNITMIGRP